MNHLENIQAVIFDFDDTLVTTRAVKWQALIETALVYYDLNIDEHHIRQFWGKPFREMLTGVLQSAAEYEHLLASYKAVSARYPMQAYPEAVSTINNLLANYHVGILTASERKSVIGDLQMLGFPVSSLFYIQTSEDTTVHKPDPQVFDFILAKLLEVGIRTSEVLYVGDDVKDFTAAAGAGVKFVGIARDEIAQQRFAEVGAKWVQELSELES